MKVAFFHPYKMADHYFVEAVEAAMIADLVADGHDAEAVEFLFEPARPEEEQIREMRAELEKQGYGLLFLERPWSDAMVRSLAGIRVAAYARPELVERGLVDVGVIDTTRGVVRALVRAIAEGLDLAGVPGILYRDGDVTRRTESTGGLSVLRELRDASFAFGRRRVLSRGAANKERAVVLSNLGCAYRNVPNRTPVFDGVDMPEDVSTAGCTFCSASAYERMTEGEALDLIVQQVASVLRDRPEVKEIAIKDDYAVRFLGKLGDALRAIGIGDRRVLLSARAEYLLEFRSDIEEALAGRFPAPIGFYLIGFESFSEAELLRFHKGMSAAQIERVIVLIREWSERYPGRFEIAPTGGFILFTPWTTIEDLRINASAMRRLDFERHRGGALLSQLRLYPNLPLYWLAKRDGLLVDAFERDEMSDAHRRGYEADHPWRFQDPKVAEVHRRLLAARDAEAPDLFEVFEEALDEAAGVARGKKHRPLRMVRAPNDKERAGLATRNVTINRACNQACGFCTYRASGPEPEEAGRAASRVRAAKAIQGVRAAAQEGTRALVITGAEPTLEWYLADLVRLARDLGIPEVVLETNATLVDAEMARTLAEAGVTRAVVALNAMDAAVSDAITRDPGGHARTVRGVRALLAEGIPVELSVALLLQNRGALAAIASGARALFPKTKAGVEAIAARYIPASPRYPRPLPVLLAAAELAAGAAAGTKSDVVVRVTPGGELPPCLFENPQEARSALRIGEAIVARDSGAHERIPACAACAVNNVCPGPIRTAAAAVAAAARPIEDGARLEGLLPVSNQRARVLSEYRSQFFLTAPDGAVRERRIVRVNFHCNQACDFCFVSRELPQVEHDLVEREIREAAARGAVLDLSGGEPTLHPRLPEYIALARDLGVREVELQTNAVKMADPEYAKILWESGLRQAFVSLHGITAKVSDRVTAAPGTFDKTILGIRNLRALGVAVRLNFVLCGYNVEELARFPDFVAQEIQGDRPGPLPDINFSFVAASTDNVPRDTGLIPRFSDVAWALATAHERATALGIHMTGFDSKCGVPACYMPRAVREEHFARDIPAEELARAAGFEKSEACARCELNTRCYGIRSSYAELYGLGELRPIVNGEVQSPPPPGNDTKYSASSDSRSPLWTAIGLSPSHALRPGSAERLTDDASFARHPRPWVATVDAGLDREVVQLEGGLRDIIKIERGSPSAAEETAAAFRARGFSAGVYIGPAGPGGSSRRAMAFIGKSDERVAEALAIEPGLTASYRERAPLVQRMGRLLGYPSCCVDAFATSAEQDDTTHIERLARAHPGSLAPEQNWAATPIRPFSHFPCTPVCERTSRLARATLDLMPARYRTALLHALGSVALITAADRFALLLDAKPDGPFAFTYGDVLSHKNLGMEDAILSRPAFRAFYLEIIAPLEEGSRVARSGARLTITRGPRKIAEITFAAQAPPLLDFTAPRAVRRLPLSP